MKQSLMMSGMAVFASFLVVACGDANFAGTTKRASAAQRAGGTAGPDTVAPTVEPGKTTPLDPVVNAPVLPLPGSEIPGSDLHALNACLAKFNGFPFSAQQIQNYRKISAAVSVLSTGSAIKDTVVTPGPELVLINAAVNVLGTVRYELMNPNAFYCLKVGVDVIGTTTVDLACGARLADSKVNVNVLSQGDPAGAVGVHVMSTVKVNRVGGCQ